MTPSAPRSVVDRSLSHRSILHRILVPLVVLLLAFSSALPAVAANSEEARIAETRASLAAVREELSGANENADGAQLALEDADRQIEAVFTAIETAQQAVGRQQESVDAAESSLGEAQTQLVEQEARLADRISRLYRQVRPDDLLTVLDASTVSQAVQQTAYMTAIGREDRVLVEGLTNARSRVEARTVALEMERVALEGVVGEQQLLLVDVEEVRNDRAVIAAASQDLVARLQSREDHLEEEAAQLVRDMRARAAAAAAAEAAATAAATAAARAATVLADEVADTNGDGEVDAEEAAEAPAMEAPPPPPAPAAAAPAPSAGGGFSWPAGGTVTSGFGPRWGRNHNGIDIAGGHGSAIVAARGGTVIRAEPYSGYGNFVSIAHANGFVTNYAHLSSIAVSAGQSVGAGTYLGGMGCSGSCTGTHLHFEISANGSYVNPMSYL